MAKEARTQDGKRIKAEQLQRFTAIREKLDKNLVELRGREPYIKVKYAVAKMFF